MKDVTKFEARTEQYLIQYEKAVSALQAAKDELSLEGLTVVDITIEALRARGKIAHDERAKQAARELEVEKYRTAAIIAQAIIDRDKPTYTSGGGNGSAKRDMLYGINGMLLKAGWNRKEAQLAVRIGRLTEPKLLALKKIRKSLRGAMEGKRLGIKQIRNVTRSAAWNNLYSSSNPNSIHLTVVSARMQRVSAKQIAEEFEKRDEIILARRSVTQVRDWCDQFLKTLSKVRS